MVRDTFIGSQPAEGSPSPGKIPGAPLRHISHPVYKEDDAGGFTWNGL
jgi:hypothetical protein